MGDTVRDLERPKPLHEDEPLFFPEEEEFGILDDISVRRSPGEMIEDDGKLRDASAGEDGPKVPKLDKIVAGTTVAYSIDKKKFRVKCYQCHEVSD